MSILKTIGRMMNPGKLRDQYEGREVRIMLYSTGVAFALAIYFGGDKLFRDPSVVSQKSIRTKPLPEQYEETGNQGHLNPTVKTKSWSSRIFTSPSKGENIVAQYNSAPNIQREKETLERAAGRPVDK